MSSKDPCDHQTEMTEIPRPCHWAAEENSKYCIFHQPIKNKENEKVRRELLRAINGQRDDKILKSIYEGRDSDALAKEFVGAKFGVLNLSNRSLNADDTNRIEFSHCEIEQISLYNSTIHHSLHILSTNIGEVQIKQAEFRRDIRIRDSEISIMDAARTNFEREFLLQTTDIEKGLSFTRATFNRDCRLYPRAQDNEPILVSFRYGRVPTGTLNVPTDSSVIYDLTHSTIGDLTIQSSSSVLDPLENVRIYLTNFNGFDFASHESIFTNSNYKLFEISDINFEDVFRTVDLHNQVPSIKLQNNISEANIDATDVRNTYLKVRNAASETGANLVASHFFVKEMRYRRRTYWQMIHSFGSPRDQLGGVESLISNYLLEWTTGYGERPRRVVSASIGIVIIFAGLFALVRPTTPYGSSLGYFVLSLESFVTLVLNDSVPIESLWVRLLAQIEGFIGVFMIGLFVFTLTRSVNR